MTKNSPKNDNYKFQEYDQYRDCINFLCSHYRLGRKYQPLSGAVLIWTVMLKKMRRFFFSNRAVYGSYRLICDVNNNRTNHMFISCVNYAAYRSLAESFHWSNLYSDRLHGNHKCRQWQLPRSPGTLRKKVLYERINIKANYPLCNQQIVHFLYIRHLQRCVTVNSYEF